MKLLIALCLLPTLALAEDCSQYLSSDARRYCESRRLRDWQAWSDRQELIEAEKRQAEALEEINARIREEEHRKDWALSGVPLDIYGNPISKRNRD